MSASPKIRSALASAAALGLLVSTGEAAAQPKPKEACYGIAKRGQNDCGNLSGSHSCAGQARTSLDPLEWRYVPTGTSHQLKGLLLAEAREAYRQRTAGAPPPATATTPDDRDPTRTK